MVGLSYRAGDVIAMVVDGACLTPTEYRYDSSSVFPASSFLSHDYALIGVGGGGVDGNWTTLPALLVDQSVSVSTIP